MTRLDTTKTSNNNEVAKQMDSSDRRRSRLRKRREVVTRFIAVMHYNLFVFNAHIGDYKNMKKHSLYTCVG